MDGARMDMDTVRMARGRAWTDMDGAPMDMDGKWTAWTCTDMGG